jgi:hypothetical protein
MVRQPQPPRRGVAGKWFARDCDSPKSIRTKFINSCHIKTSLNLELAIGSDALSTPLGLGVPHLSQVEKHPAKTYLSILIDICLY